MKIDESFINHNVVRLVHEISSHAYEMDTPEQYMMSLAEISGILDLANAMKEVLNA